MECQACSKLFPTANALDAHVGHFQTQAKYHIRQLLKCLAHDDYNDPPHGKDRTTPAPDHSIDADRSLLQNEDRAASVVGSSVNANDDIDDDSDSNDESVENRGNYTCPLNCKKTLAFKTHGDLRRHFAIHTSCCELCPFCERIFHRASRYLHHNCKKGDGTSVGIPQQRAALRKNVRKELEKAQLIANDQDKRQRRRNAKGNNAFQVSANGAELELDGIASASRNSPRNAEILLNPTQPSNISEQYPGANAVFDMPTTSPFARGFMVPYNNAQESQSFSTEAQEFYGNPSSGGELQAPATAAFGSKSPVVYSAESFRAPALTSFNGAFSTPSFSSALLSGSMAPTFSSDMP